MRVISRGLTPSDAMQKSLVRDTTLDTGTGKVALEGDVRRCHCKSSEELRAECPRKGAGMCWVCPATRAGEEERRGGGRRQATAGHTAGAGASGLFLGSQSWSVAETGPEPCPCPLPPSSGLSSTLCSPSNLGRRCLLSPNSKEGLQCFRTNVDF